MSSFIASRNEIAQTKAISNFKAKYTIENGQYKQLLSDLVEIVDRGLFYGIHHPKFTTCVFTSMKAEFDELIEKVKIEITENRNKKPN